MKSYNWGNKNALKQPQDVKSSRVTVRLTQSQKTILRKLAQSSGVTESELIISRFPEVK
ncbi:MAG: CopG family transcriptional regulator [bacterium]